MNPLNLFPGSKTYLIGVGMLVYGLVGMFFGWVDQAEAGRIILEGAGLLALRKAVSGVQENI